MGEFDWVERGRGILTKRDRRFLRGELTDELNDNQRYQKRYQIRQRIRNAMFDFHILYRLLPRRDLSMLWDGTDDWIYRSQTQRQRGDAPPYPDIPLLGRCWRDLIAFFTYSQIITGVPEAESLVKWVIEEGVNKAVRRNALSNHNKYQEVNSELDFGVGQTYHLLDYLQHVGQKIPDDPDEAEEFLLDLQRDEFLQSHHVTYLYEEYVNNRS
jgi:hypothetical protein